MLSTPEQQELLRAHLEGAPLAIIQWDNELRVRSWSGRAAEMFGWSPAEVEGKHPLSWKFVYDDDISAVEPVLADVKAGDCATKIARCRLHRKDGSILHSEWFSTVVRDAGGQMQSVVSFVSDVSARVAAEQCARESQERYEALAAVTSDGVFIHDTKVIVDANPRFAELMGYSVDEIIGMDALSLVAPNTREKALAAAARKSREPYEMVALRKDGTEILVELTPTSLQYRGQMVRGCSVRDLTEQRRRENALRESERLNRAIFEESAVGMSLIDLKGRFLRVNTALARFFRAPATTLIGRTFSDFTQKDFVASNLELFQSLVEGRLSNYSLEKCYRLHDGSEAWAQATAVLVRGPGGEAYVFSVLEDITKRKQAEAERDALLAREQRAREEAESLVQQRTVELARTRDQLVQQERLAMAGQLAAGVAHEVNNPLAFVISSLEFLREELNPVFSRLSGGERTELESALSDAQQGARRIRNIVAELKSFSRQDTDEPMLVDVRKAADFSAAMAMPQIRCRAQLAKEYGETPEVWATETRLGQVLLNLIVNAAHAIPEGAASAHTITLKTCTTDSGEAVIEVRDTGKGIPPELLPRIFEPFFTTKSQGQGTGLGLSICLGIVQSLGGRIDVSSEVGVGSSFRIVLPAAKAPVSNVVQHPTMGRASAKLAGARILVVDDEPGITNALRRLLGSANEVVPVHSGAAALEAVGGGAHYDLVLCDLMMPELTGVEVYEALEKVRPDLVSRFVLMTGGAFTERGTEFLKTGVKQLQKPFNSAQLQALVADARRVPTGKPELKLVTGGV